MSFAISNVAGRQLFGDWSATAALKASDDNFEKVLKFLDDLVEKRIKKLLSKKADEADPRCLVDILLNSDIYRDRVTIISNDLFIGMFASTDTSRNATTISLVHMM